MWIQLSTDLSHRFLFQQKMSAREFSRRSIKERAVLLSSLFTESNKPAPSVPESQVVTPTTNTNTNA